MVTLQPAALRRQGADLAQSSPYNPKRLVLLHTAVALGLALLITALNYILNLQIADTGGLAGLPLRTVLSTVQAVLELALVVALPFWEIGLLFAALNWTSGNPASPRDFWQGFRRAGSVLALRLITGVVFFILSFAAVNLCSTIFLFTPWAKPLLEMIEPILSQAAVNPQQASQLLTPEVLAQAARASIPLLILSAALFAAIAIPLFYRLRFAKFAVVSGAGGLRGIMHSVRLTQGNRLRIFQLDLSFWWFYLLQALCLVISYGDTLLPLVGITLPISEGGAFFLFYILGAACQGLLLWQYQAKVLTAYCLAYNQLSQMPKTGIVQNPPPKVPWRI